MTPNNYIPCMLIASGAGLAGERPNTGQNGKGQQSRDEPTQYTPDEEAGGNVAPGTRDDREEGKMINSKVCVILFLFFSC